MAKSSLDSKSAAVVSGIVKAIYSFEFLLSTVICYDVLSKANPVSKNLQSDNTNIDIAVFQRTALLPSSRSLEKVDLLNA